MQFVYINAHLLCNCFTRKTVRLDELVSPAIAALLCLLILKHCPKTLQVVLLMCVAKWISSFQQLHSLWVLLGFFSTVVPFLKCSVWQKAFGVAFTNMGVIWLVNTMDWQLTSTVFSCCAFQLEITSRAASSSDVKDLLKKCQLSAWFLVCSALT